MKIEYLNQESVFSSIDESVLNNGILLTEDDFKGLMCEFLFESLSISEEVERVSWRLYTIIRNKVVKEKEFKGEFPFRVFDKNFIIKWQVYDYYNLNENVFVGAEVNFDTLTINLGLIVCDGEVDFDHLNDSLQHEVEHVYQRMKRKEYGAKIGKDLDNNFNLKAKKLYDAARELMIDSNRKSFKYNLGRAVYLTFKSEQDAYVNGLYGKLKNNQSNISLEKLLYDTDAYKQLRFMRSFYKKVFVDHLVKQEEFDELLNFLGVKEKWLERTLGEAINRFSEKIGKVFSKFF